MPGLLLIGFLLVLFSVKSCSRSVALAFDVVALLGLVQSGFIPLVNTVLVEVAPPGLRGRVIGLPSLDRAMMPLGGSWLASWRLPLGPR